MMYNLMRVPRRSWGREMGTRQAWRLHVSIERFRDIFLLDPACSLGHVLYNSLEQRDESVP